MKTQLHIKIITVAMLFFMSESTFSQASLLKDIFTGRGDSAPIGALNMGNYGVFSANSQMYNRELWITDGTTNGTVILKDIQPGGVGSFPANFTKINDLVFFTATTVNEGDELWKTDGTEAGTVLVKDIATGVEKNAYVYQLTNFNGELFFLASLDDDNNQVIWKTDGTEEGTTIVKNIRPNVLFGFPSISEFVPTNFGLMFFSATDGINGKELWATDGTAGGTLMVKDINIGSGDAGVSHITALGGNVYFQVLEAGGASSLWKSDGTAAGTSVVVTDLSFERTGFMVFKDKIYFAGQTPGDIYGTELWATDGTAAGTSLVKDLSLGASSGAPTSFAVAGNKLFFKAFTEANGAELWVTDGTAAGTKLVKDMNPGADSALVLSDYEKRLKAIGNNVYFSASASAADGETLWVSDGTSAGTYSIMDVNPDGDDAIEEIVAVNNTLLFRAVTPTYGFEFWRLDTVLSTNDVADLSKLKIFPNPVSETLTIENTFLGTVQLKVINQLGQVVLKQILNTSSILLDVSSLSKGLYFLNFDSEDGNIQTIKFIKN